MSSTSPNHNEPTRFALSSLIDAMPDAIVIVDTEGRIVDVNVQAVGMFGYTRQELLGNAVEVLVPEGVRDRHVAERTGYVRNPRVRPMGAEIRLAAVHKEGRAFQVEIRLAPYQAPDGLLVVASVRDVAAQNRRSDEPA
jgi:PAS domain S-box-containing protein